MVYVDERNIKWCSECDKRCYSEREAGSILNSCKRHRNSDHCGRNKELPRRKYWCNSCGHYHLTHYREWSSVDCTKEDKFYMEYENKKRRVNAA